MLGDRSWSRAGRLRELLLVVVLRSAYYIAAPAADEGDHDQRQPGGPCERIGGCAPQSLSCSSGSRSLLVRALPVIGAAPGAGGGARVAAGLG